MKTIRFELGHFFLPWLLWTLVTLIINSAIIAGSFYYPDVFNTLITTLSNHPDVFTSALRFYSLVVIFLKLSSAGFAGWLAINLISVVRNKTSDFILTRPVLKSAVFNSKMFVLFLYSLLFNLVLFVGSFFIGEYFYKTFFDFVTLILIHSGILLFTLIFATIGVWLVTVSKKTRLIMASMLAVVILTFMFSFFTGLSAMPWSDYLAYFVYFPLGSFLSTKGLNLGMLAFTSILIILCLIWSSLVYLKKDIRDPEKRPPKTKKVKAPKEPKKKVPKAPKKKAPKKPKPKKAPKPKKVKKSRR